MYTEKDNGFWREYADLLNAEFKPREYWHSPKALKLYRNIPVVFDGYFHTAISNNQSYENFYIRVCASYNSSTHFKFSISKNTFLKKLVKLFYDNSFKTYEYDFDRQYSITTNDRIVTGKIFQEKEIRILIASLQEINIETGVQAGESPDGQSVLTYTRRGRTIEEKQLLIINNLFEKIIDKLYQLKIIKT